jgi:surfeit locus 1 family protein
MTRRVPPIPTILVAAASATMVMLGMWQLDRAKWKEGLLAEYDAARGLPEMTFPTAPLSPPLPLFRRARGYCLAVASWRQVVGHDRRGEVGYAHVAQCRTGAEGPGMTVEAGWSKDPSVRPNWSGGRVAGLIAPDSKTRLRLVSAQGLGGLAASAPPSIDAIPNNHRMYAAQWFIFAALAVLIYALALRGRRRNSAP